MAAKYKKLWFINNSQKTQITILIVWYNFRQSESIKLATP